MKLSHVIILITTLFIYLLILVPFVIADRVFGIKTLLFFLILNMLILLKRSLIATLVLALLFLWDNGGTIKNQIRLQTAMKDTISLCD